MLFLVYYELNPSLDPSEILNAYQKIQEAEIKQEKWDVKGWYITPEHWGVAIVDTDSVDDVLINANAWRIALPGLFIKYNISPVKEVEESVPILAKLVRKLKK